MVGSAPALIYAAASIILIPTPGIEKGTYEESNEG